MYFEVALSSEATIEFSRKAMLAGEVGKAKWLR